MRSGKILKNFQGRADSLMGWIWDVRENDRVFCPKQLQKLNFHILVIWERLRKEQIFLDRELERKSRIQFCLC